MMSAHHVSISLLVVILILACLTGFSAASDEGYLKSMAFDKAKAAGCIERFGNQQTDTKIRHTGTCEGDNTHVQHEAVIWPHCEGDMCGAMRMRPVAAVVWACSGEVTVKCLLD